LQTKTSEPQREYWYLLYASRKNSLSLKEPLYLFVMKNRRKRRANGNNRREKRTPTAKYKTSFLHRDLRVLLLVGELNSFIPLTPERLGVHVRYNILLILYNKSIVSLYTERSEIHYSFCDLLNVSVTRIYRSFRMCSDGKLSTGSIFVVSGPVTSVDVKYKITGTSVVTEASSPRVRRGYAQRE